MPAPQGDGYSQGVSRNSEHAHSQAHTAARPLPQLSRHQAPHLEKEVTTVLALQGSCELTKKLVLSLAHGQGSVRTGYSVQRRNPSTVRCKAAGPQRRPWPLSLLLIKEQRHRRYSQSFLIHHSFNPDGSLFRVKFTYSCCGENTRTETI